MLVHYVTEPCICVAAAGAKSQTPGPKALVAARGGQKQAWE